MLKEPKIDLEIRVALLGQRQDQLEGALQVLDRRLGRMEVSLDSLHTTVARWGGAISVLSAGSFLAAALL